MDHPDVRIVSRNNGADEPNGLPAKRVVAQRATLTLAISVASFVFAIGGVGATLYMYWNTAEALQEAQTELQRKTGTKVGHETNTALVEAKYAEPRTTLEVQNEALKSELLKTQTELAKSQKQTADSQTAVNNVEAAIKTIGLELNRATIGTPAFQNALGQQFANVTETVKCISPLKDESEAAFKQRCSESIIHNLIMPGWTPSKAEALNRTLPAYLQPSRQAYPPEAELRSCKGFLCGPNFEK